MESDTNSVTGVFRNGRVELSTPAGWTDGMQVVVTPVPVPASDAAVPSDGDPPFKMMREEDWPTTPEGIAALLERWKQHEPLIFTPEEKAQIAADREWFKQYELKKLREEWESEQ